MLTRRLRADGGTSARLPDRNFAGEQNLPWNRQLPFPILGFDFDNSSEWLNWTLIRHLQVRTKPVRVTRSRPYHKDDNAYVEQKNWMWPAAIAGLWPLGR